MPTLGGGKRGRLCVPPHPSWKLEGTDPVPWGRRARGGAL